MIRKCTEVHVEQGDDGSYLDPSHCCRASTGRVAIFVQMNTTSAERPALLSKISALMDYRLLPLLLETVEPCRSVREDLLQGLTALQVAIYDLDHYLETTWVLDADQLDHWWSYIYTALDRLDVPAALHRDYVRHILKYQKHEVQLRDGLLPTRFDMQYFYFYKSCDVKLLRRIIYSRYPRLSTMYSLADWRAFDLVTEVDDDVEDVYEDQTTINGNRFLITIWESGFDVAKQQFLGFLEEIEGMVEERFGASKSATSHGQLYTWSMAVLRDTRCRLITTPYIGQDGVSTWLNKS